MTFEAQFQIGACSYTVRAPDAKGVLDLTTGLQAAVAQPPSTHDIPLVAPAPADSNIERLNEMYKWLCKPPEREWLPWPRSGLCHPGMTPVLLGTPIFVRHRDGAKYRTLVGHKHAARWTHEGTTGDIIAFKVVKP